MRNMRTSRPAKLALGAIVLTVPGSAAALAAGQADAQSALQISARSHQITYGHSLKVTGLAPRADAGRSVLLQFAPAGHSGWRGVARTRVGHRGRFGFSVSLRQSGLLRAVESTATIRSTAAATSGPKTGQSPTRAVVVKPAFRLHRGREQVLEGSRAWVGGKLLPGQSGRRVLLERHTKRGWRVLASGRTGRRGGFRIRFAPGGLGVHRLLVWFGGDRLNSAAAHGTGRVMVFRQSLASWYNDGGSTACGFHAGYGVAHKTLPCGTKVTFRHGGHTVTATVDDRGPFVAGREWDLNQNTAAALGFGGVGAVWSTS